MSIRRRTIPRPVRTCRRTFGQRSFGALRAAIAILATTLAGAASTFAQNGQMGMTPAPGLVNQATAALADGSGSLPGWLYYGVNAADRGLGYRGSYMTLGGFIPYAEDDLGGLWAADLRSHLSVYGGFFSNVGMVRKQFIGGTLLGVGVFWDYDGDQNQYSDTFIEDDSGTYVFAGGESYNQVGVSGEWLTDWGNLRSNGYIPVGRTATTMGPFVGNSLLAVNGINAALGGADLELGAYIPGLADWAGMISVGGYALANERYEFPNGAAVVPWFGGVYTRLDMTFLRGWDFSLQANNDSYFDWTGFARLTYRMGGSRRRNVPDQVEQPMMRNEHVVRAHQEPVQAINPTSGFAWRIIHIDNSSAVVGAGNGTIENPYKELVQGRDAADREFDVVFLHTGISHQTPYAIPVPPSNPLLNPDPTGTPPGAQPIYPNAAYDGSYFFQASNQYLVGEGTSLKLNTVDRGPVALDPGARPGEYPVITNAAGTAVILTSGTGDTTNATVDHIEIRDSYVGISDGPGLPRNGYASVNDVRIIGTGPSQRGVEITDPNGEGRSTLNFTNMFLDSLTRDGFYVVPADGFAPDLSEIQVNVSHSQIQNIGGSGVFTEDLVGEARVRLEDVAIEFTTAPGVHSRNSQATIYDSFFRQTGIAGVQAENQSIVQVVRSEFTEVEIGIQATSLEGVLNLTANDNIIKQSLSRIGNGIVLATPNPAGPGDTPYVQANLVGNDIISVGTQDIVLYDFSGLTVANLFIKAADAANLQAINHNAQIYRVFPNDPTLAPPPPKYDPALDVLLPPQ